MVLCTLCTTGTVLDESSVSLIGFQINSRFVDLGMLALT